MAMNKSDKETAVNELHEKMTKATFAAAVSYNKLNANQSIEFRKALRNAKVDFKIIKNTLALRAAKDTVAEKLGGHFKGQMAVALGYGDVVQVAKAITEALKKAPDALTVKGAIAEGSVLDGKGVEALSKMPGLNESRAMLLGMLKQPATRLAQIINAPSSALARVVNAHVEKAGGEKAA